MSAERITRVARRRRIKQFRAHLARDNGRLHHPGSAE